MTSLSQIDECPACGCTDIETDIDIADGICRGCGLVHEGDGWASGASDIGSISDESDRPSADLDLQDVISVGDASEQLLVSVLSNTDEVANELELGEQERVRAAELVTNIWTKNLMHGRDRESMIAACIYATCRESGHPRPLPIVALVASADEKKLKKSYRVLLSELEFDIDPAVPQGYLRYLCDKLSVPGKLKRRAATRISKSERIGGNPAGIAAAAIYLENERDQKTSTPLTLREAGEAVGVTKETIWRKSKELGSG